MPFTQEMSSKVPENGFERMETAIGVSTASVTEMPGSTSVKGLKVSQRGHERDFVPSTSNNVVSQFIHERVNESTSTQRGSPSAHSSEECLQEHEESAVGTTEAPSIILSTDHSSTTNCCCQVLREQLAVEVMKRISAEKKVMELEAAMAGVLQQDSSLQQNGEKLHCDANEGDASRQDLEAPSTVERYMTKDLEEEVSHLRGLLEAREKEILVKEERIGLLQEKLVNQVLESDRKDGRTKRGVITGDNMSRAASQFPPERRTYGVSTRLSLERVPHSLSHRSPLSSYAPRSSSPTVHRPAVQSYRSISYSSASSSLFRGTGYLPQTDEHNRPPTPTRNTRSRRDFSSSPLRPLSRGSPSPYTANRPRSGLTPQAPFSVARGSTAVLRGNTSSRLASAPRDSFSQLPQASPLRHSSRSDSGRQGSTGIPSRTTTVIHQKKRIPEGGSTTSRNSSFSFNRSTASDVSRKDTQQMTPVRSHPGTRSMGVCTPSPKPQKVSGGKTSSIGTSDSTISKVVMPLRTNNSRDVRNSAGVRERKEGDDVPGLHLERGPTVSVKSAFSPLYRLSPSRRIGKNGLSKEGNALNSSTEWDLKEPTVIKGTTTTVTFGRNKKIATDLNAGTSRSVVYDPSFELFENVPPTAVNAQRRETKSIGNIYEKESRTKA